MDYKKLIKPIGIGILSLIVIFWVLPNIVNYNTSGYRTVIELPTGGVSVKFSPGFYFKGFGKSSSYTDIVTVNYTKDDANSSIDIDPITIRFNDGTSASSEGVVKFVLPKDELLMIKLHKDYRTQENLGLTGLKPFVTECLKNSAQLMSSEMHYLGGRSNMSTDFQDQLESGVYLLTTVDKIIKDTVEKDTKRVYLTEKTKDKNGQLVRKKSFLTQYGIGVSDAVISDVDYEDRVDKLLALKIDATSKTSISKQQLMLEQQKALTAEAEGKKRLVEIEYQERQSQTKSVIQAQTRVQMAEQDKNTQRILADAAVEEARKIKILADAKAYEKQRIMSADGALDKKLAAYTDVNKSWAEAFSKYQGAIVPYYINGGNSGQQSNAALQFMEIMSAKASKDLMMDIKSK